MTRSDPMEDDEIRAAPPKDGYRAMSWPSEVREEAGQPTRLVGHFARFDTFNEINSATEGRFMERIARGAFKKTFAENRSIKVLFQHGKDPSVGEQPIAKVIELREDEHGPYYEAELLDGIPPLVLDGLRKGVYGVSYRFSVEPSRDDFDPRPGRSPTNPNGLPERTIRQSWVYEFGPVTFPADAGADIAVRSITDQMTSPPEAPSLDAAETHLEPERSEPEPIAEPQHQESPKVDISQYRTLDEMGARQRELDAEIARAAEIPGILPDAEQAAFDEKVAERAALDHAMTSWRNRLSQVRAAAENPATNVPTYEAVASFSRKTETDIYDLDAITRSAGSPEQRDQKLRDNAMRAAEQLRVPGERFDQDKSRERLADLIDFKDSRDKEIARRVLTTNSPQYREAFNRYVSSLGTERGTALAVGVDGTGGFSVPVSFDPTIVAIGAWTAINPYRAACRVETIAGTDTWQALTSTAVTAVYTTEAAAATEQGPTFTRPEYVVKRAQAFVTASFEMVQDRPSLAGDLGTLFGEAKDNLEENQFTVGVGTTVYPEGIGLKDAYTRVDSATNDTVAVADIRSLEAGVPIRHRMNAAWFLSRAAIRAIQAFETSGGQLFNGTNYAAVGNPVNSSTGNTGLTLLGYPIWETPSMPWTPTTDDTTWGCLIDPKTYVIVDRVGMSVRVYDQIMDGATPSMPTGQVGFLAFWRNTARVLNVGGGRQGAVQ
jgi:HK97 family phage major capsid protein/HK97 family phage prohead protease